jgi:sensor histidine kinase YesM
MSFLSSKLSNISIRSRLFFTAFIGFFLMGSVILYITQLVNMTMNSVGDSYITNIELQDYDELLTSTENAMEEYIRYRTFEAIDTYYQFRAKTEMKSMSFSKTPSLNKVAMQEYKVSKLVESFLFYSNNTVAAKRANNTLAAEKNFSITLECYGWLNKALEKLNTMYFTNNAELYESNKQSITRANRNSMLVVFCVSIIALGLVYVVIRNITQPLIEISEVAHRVAERDFDIPLFKRDTHDEIGNICRAFNRMIISIREYIDTIWEKAIQENQLREREIEMTALYKDAQLRALQGQINPHFLFNTLNTGAQLAMMEEADKTCFFLEQVSDFFRYNIQQNDIDTTIESELKILDKFIYIMKVRFGSRFEFRTNIADVSLSTRMPSMILQPLVENCLNHGLHDVAKGGLVSVSVEKKDSAIIISISDNGCGFPQEVKEQVLAGKAEGIGISNVMSRLRLYFKTDDVFDIRKNPAGKGTLFLIRIPNV